MTDAISELRIVVEKENHLLTPKSYAAVKNFFLATKASSNGRKSLKDRSPEYRIQEYLFNTDGCGNIALTAAEVIEDFYCTLKNQPDFELWFREASSFKRKDYAKPVLFPARWLCHLAGFRHLSVHLFLTPDGDDKHMLVQVRGIEKAESPGCFDIPVGGHVEAGQTEQEALLREAGEELSLEAGDLMNLTAIGGYDYKDSDSNARICNVEFRRVFKARLLPTTLASLRPASEEVAAIALFSISAIESLIATFPERVASGLRSSMPLYMGCR